MTRKELTTFLIEGLDQLSNYKAKYVASRQGIYFTKKKDIGTIEIDIPLFTNKGLEIADFISAAVYPNELEPILNEFKTKFPTIFRPQVENSVIFYSKRHVELESVPTGDILRPYTRRTFLEKDDAEEVLIILQRILIEEVFPFLEKVNNLGDCYEYINNSPTAAIRHRKYVGNQVYWLAIKALVKAPDFHANFQEYLNYLKEEKLKEPTGNAVPIENELELIEGCYQYLSQVYTNAQQIPGILYRETHLLPTQREIITAKIENRKQRIDNLPKAIENFHQKISLLQEQIALGNNVEKYKQNVEFITNSVIPGKRKELEECKQDLVNFENQLSALD